MDNSYVSLNIDVSPDIVALLHTVALLVGVAYVGRRLLQAFQPSPPPAPAVAA